jgi:hypothetical protein
MRRRRPQTEEQAVTVDGREIRLLEDGSEIWAWHLRGAQPDSTGMILQQFTGKLREATSEEAELIVSILFGKNRLSILFATLLMVAAERPEIYADLLWSFATNEKVLLSRALRTDAIAAIAAFYPSRTPEGRRALELAAFHYGADDQFHKMEHERWLATLFQAIGSDELVTDEARSFLLTEEGSKPRANEHFAPAARVVEVTQRQMLEEFGIDFDEPGNDALQRKSESVKIALGIHQGGASKIEDVPLALQELKELHEAIQDAESRGIHNNVISSAEDMAGDLAVAILKSLEASKATPLVADLDLLKEVSVSLSRSEREQFGRAPRTAIVPALFYLCQHPATAAEALERLAVLASDATSDVRFQVAQNLATLNGFAPEKMWEIAERICEEEEDEAVLHAFVAGFLSWLVPHDLARVESMLLSIRERFPFERPSISKRPAENLNQSMAQLFAGLYVWQNRDACRDEVFRWAATPLQHQEQIRSGLHAVRAAVSAGYDDADDIETTMARQRVQALLREIVATTTSGIEAYYKLDSKAQEAHFEQAKTLAECLHYASSTLYFGSGAFPERNMPHTSTIKTVPGKERFIHDIEPLLKRIGDAPVPQTTYQLVQLLDFLLPGNPAFCFGLFADIMRTSGRRQRFQLESLGVDVMVRLVSQCLADHESIFRDDGLRRSLVDCIDIFVDAGWPAAIRLAYRVPDALR